MRAAHRELLLVRSARDHLGAEHLANLYRGETYSSRGTQHQQRLTGTKLTTIGKRVIGCAVGRRQARGAGKLYRLGKRSQAVGIGDYFFGIAAVCRLGTDPIADLPAFDAGTDSLHYPCDFGARDERQLGLGLIFILDDERVRKFNVGRLHAHHNLAWPGYKRRTILDD